MAKKSPKSPAFSELERECVKLWSEIRGLQSEGLLKAKECGELLIQIKKELKHGEYEEWVKSKFKENAARSTAGQYRRIAEGWEIIEPELKENPGWGPVEAAKFLAKVNQRPKVYGSSRLDQAKKKLFQESYAIWKDAKDEAYDLDEQQRQLAREYNKAAAIERASMPLDRGIHFFDSGAYSLMGEEAENWRKKHTNDPWGYYHSEHFFQYMDRYAEFVRKYADGIDYYVNVDAIGDPEISWRNHRYLESRHGLSPVPVIHCLTDLKWIHHYINRGHELIGVSRLHKRDKKEKRQKWLQDVFEIVCGTPNRMPKVKVHAFGTTRTDILRKYPFWSADSTLWSDVAIKVRQGIYVPRRDDKGEFIFQGTHRSFRVGYHEYHNEFTPCETNDKDEADAKEWLEMIDIPWGEVERRKAKEDGVINNPKCRLAANAIYFNLLSYAFPDWPWPLPEKGQSGPLKNVREAMEHKERQYARERE